MRNKNLVTILIVLFAVFVAIAYSSLNIFITLKPGEKAVIFRKFSTGLDKENIFSAGFHMVAPWNQLIRYEVREQKSEETMDILDKNGLALSVDISVRYHPIYDRIGYIHEIFGEHYPLTLVIPEVRAAVREMMGRYSAEEIYSTKRAEVEYSIITETSETLTKNNITMTALLIRSINLPAQIKQAIENKLKQEQESLAYEFKLTKEKSEAERRLIEANGIAKANKIISSSLTPTLLKMKGIDATQILAESANAKVVVIGSGKDGLPLILGGN